jgi:hypothetical protein
MAGITDIGAAAAEESQDSSDLNGDEQNDYTRFDLDGCSFGKQHPTTAVRGQAVALRGLYDENDPDRGDVAVILDDPSAVTSEPTLEGSVVVQSEEEGDQFKVVNTDDDQTKVLEGMGIDFAGNTFYGDVEDGFGDMDRIALKRGGGAGRRIARTLDVSGADAAEEMIERNDDGEITDLTLNDEGFPAHNGGFVEYDNEGDELPRQSRAPQLRDDVKGREVVVMIQRLSEIDPDYDGPSYWATVFANLPDDRQAEVTEQYAQESEDKSAEDFVTELDGTEFVKLSPTSEFEPDDALLEETGYIEWNGFDRTVESDVLAVNEARIEGGHGSVYIPEGADPDDVVPDTVDNLELDPDEDDWDDDADVTPAFGAGADAETVQSA